jgi:hypothetical protein
MATVLQQVLDRLDSLLKACVPPGCTVHRDRADAQSRAEAPSINVLAQDDPVEPWAEMDLHQAEVELVFYVRDEPGAMAAEDLHAAVHPHIVADAQLAALCESRRLVEGSFDRAEADVTSTRKRVRYRFKYLIPFSTL